MLIKLLNFLVGKLDTNKLETHIYNILPKLTAKQKENIGNFALRLAKAAAEGAVAGAVKK